MELIKPLLTTNSVLALVVTLLGGFIFGFTGFGGRRGYDTSADAAVLACGGRHPRGLRSRRYGCCRLAGTWLSLYFLSDSQESRVQRTNLYISAMTMSLLTLIPLILGGYTERDSWVAESRCCYLMRPRV